ncbi:MAG: exonuclease domain-containing protein [Eubacterium sp.]|nr:exonuclease domain-containing protein [Eubacterium sp.]
MNYIVFDLEWNQSPIGQAGEHPRMPFEIIEIGAVKLDESYNVVDEFSRLVKPKIYTKLHKIIKQMLSYDEKDLKKDGVPFKQACSEFLKWSGEDSVFCTWGSSDLYYLQNNMDFYYMDKLEFPLKYYNIQQIFADKYDPDGNIWKLEKAVEELGLNEEEPFHTAVNDARYTAKVLEAAKLGDITDKYTFDIYRHPKKYEDRVEAFHDGRLDEISEEFPSKRAAMSDKELSMIRCVKCKRKTSRKIKWFAATSTADVAVGKCLYHGFMEGVIKCKAVGDSTDNVFILKKTVPISRKEYENLKKREQQVYEKKREKERQRREATREAAAASKTKKQ